MVPFLVESNPYNHPSHWEGNRLEKHNERFLSTNPSLPMGGVSRGGKGIDDGARIVPACSGLSNLYKLHRLGERGEQDVCLTGTPAVALTRPTRLSATRL